MTHHALDSVHLILHARRQADTWGPALQAQALVVMPHDWDPEAWITTVAVFASEGEHPATAAQRLAQYLLAYRESTSHFPSLAAVQKHAADRHLQEPHHG